jgi:AraC-like DNA-binding protein
VTALQPPTLSAGHIVFDDERPSDSPFIERVWRCHSERAGTFVSVASSHWEIVATRLQGRTSVTLRGPETRPRDVYCPANGEWFAIRFKAGTFMPKLNVSRLLNGNDVVLPQPSPNSFWLEGKTWELPAFDDAEALVARLAKAGVIERDRDVDAALNGDPIALSLRSMQRRFLQSTGMSFAALRQIERARHATNLLRDGASIIDTVHATGYYDQAHLTRSLRSLIGLTPARISRADQQLSFLYKTNPH